MDLAREPAVRLGGMEVRPSTREIVHANGRLVIEPQVMGVLLALARAKGEVVSREALQDACWDGRVVSDDAINRVISRIRKISDLTGGRDFTLETITKVGYRLVAAAAAAGAGTPPEPPVRARRVAPAMLLAVAGVVVAAALGAAAWWFNRPWTEEPAKPLTLAVLPFDDLGASGADEALALSMAREIRNTLSRVRGLRVVSDSSSFAAAASPMSATDMARRLGADLLLDGSLAREGDTVRVTAELVDGWSGVNLWTGDGSGPAVDLEKVRQDVSASVFEQIVKRIGPNRLELLAPPRRTDPRVYQLLLQAQEQLESTTRMRMRGRASETFDAGERAEALIDKALVIQPDDALALRLKGQLISMTATRALAAQDMPVHEKQAKAAEYYRQALAADPDNVSALAALGEYYRRFEWRWDDASALLERALALDPNHAEGRLSYSYFLSGEGRCIEALEQARLAISLDPEFGWRTLGVPRALKCLGRFEESDAAYLAALRQDPANMFVLREVYLNHLVRRDADGLERLRAMVRDELFTGETPLEVQWWLGWTETAVKALRGDTEPFAALIEEDVQRSRRMDVSLPMTEIYRAKGDVGWIQAVEFAIADKPSRAIDLLATAVSLNTLYIPETMPYGGYEFSEAVRNDPRYKAIWASDPRLRDLVQRRRKSALAGQMHGVVDGREIWPLVTMSSLAVRGP